MIVCYAEHGKYVYWRKNGNENEKENCYPRSHAIVKTFNSVRSEDGLDKGIQLKYSRQDSNNNDAKDL